MGSMATRLQHVRFLACLFLCTGFLANVLAFDITRKDNLAIYWGQDGANTQQRLSFYCQDDTVDVIPLAFLYIFRGTGGDPVIDFANTCNQWDDPVFSGSALANCTAAMASDIELCQSKGKIVTLSLGGGTGQVGFSSDSQAQTFATQVWNMFLGGTSSTRPFGKAILDGLDLDIESGTPAHYAAFVNQIRTLAAPTGKKYYITAAPQCPYPDVYIGTALNQASFDAVYVQFYNNYCGLDQPTEYNFDTWDNWAKTTSFNKDVKVYIGAPASADAAGTGYVSSSTLANYVSQAQSKYSSFGGVMMWDMDTAYSNNRFDKSVKTAMVSSAQALGLPAAQEPSSSSANSHTQNPATSTPKPASSGSAKPVSSASATRSVKVTSSGSTSVTHSAQVSVASTASATSARSSTAPAQSSATHAQSSALPTQSSALSTQSPVTSTQLPLSTSHTHRFRPHETINAVASERFAEWQLAQASYFDHARPHQTAKPVQG